MHSSRYFHRKDNKIYYPRVHQNCLLKSDIDFDKLTTLTVATSPFGGEAAFQLELINERRNVN